MMKNDADRRWSDLDELEDRAHGIFVGGLLLDVDADALSKQPIAIQSTEFSKVEALLDSLGARKIAHGKPETVDEMKKALSLIFQRNAQVAMLAARNFESLPDETVKTIYEELIALEQKVHQES